MIELAIQCLGPFSGRARVVLSDGSMHFPLPDHSVERVVSTYVLDLLSEHDTHRKFGETYRILQPGGKLCLVGLTENATPVSRIVSGLPSMAVGCGPRWSAAVVPYAANRICKQSSDRSTITTWRHNVRSHLKCWSQHQSIQLRLPSNAFVPMDRCNATGSRMYQRQVPVLPFFRAPL